MPANEPQATSPEEQQKGPEEFEPVVVEGKDPTRPGRVITADDPGVGAKGQKPTKKNDEEEGLVYWKQQAQEARERAKLAETYGPLINHLEHNPNLVDMLQNAIETGAADVTAHERMVETAHAQQTPSEEEELAAELGLEATPQRKATPQNQPNRQMTLEEAERLGAERERARREYREFHDELAARGVPDHAVDEFVQWLNNPNGLTWHDMYAAYTHSRQGAAEPTKGEQTATPQPNTPQPQTKDVRPISVTTIPAGESDRPEAGIYRETGDGSRFIQDPQNI